MVCLAHIEAELGAPQVWHPAPARQHPLADRIGQLCPIPTELCGPGWVPPWCHWAHLPWLEFAEPWGSSHFPPGPHSPMAAVFRRSQPGQPACSTSPHICFSLQCLDPALSTWLWCLVPQSCPCPAGMGICLYQPQAWPCVPALGSGSPCLRTAGEA